MSTDFPLLFVLFVALLAYALGATDKEDTRQKNRKLQQKNTELARQLNSAYHERNMLAMLAAKTMLDLGLQAGVGVDPEADPDWSHVLYIEVPGGQLSYHLAPHEVQQFRDQLPEYLKPWDGSNKDQHHQLIEAL